MKKRSDQFQNSSKFPEMYFNNLQMTYSVNYFEGNNFEVPKYSLFAQIYRISRYKLQM